jgi:hypothetical protein
MKNLFLIIFGLYISLFAQVTLALLNPKLVSSLANNTQIATWARATLQLDVYKPIQESKESPVILYSCNGVAIATNKFITATHCIIDLNDKDKPRYLHDGNAIQIQAYYLNNSKIETQFSRIKKVYYSSQFYYKVFLDSGEDVAIVELEDAGALNHFVPSANIMQFPNPWEDMDNQKVESSVLDLGRLLWDGHGTIYKLAINKNTAYYVTTEVYSQESAWDKDENSNLRFAKDYNYAYVTYNAFNQHKLYGNKGTHQFQHVLKQAYDEDYYNTNILWQPKVTEDGDSGGPTFICKDGGANGQNNVNKCYLLGVHSYSNLANGNSSVSATTLLLNPVYSKLRRMQ